MEAEQRAPRTGIPGGPHIRSVEIGDRPGAPGGNVERLRQWIFQLTDVPETQPSFDWAVFAVLDDFESSLITSAYLDGVGRLSISCPDDCDEETVLSATKELLTAAKRKLSTRAAEDAEDEEVERAILDRFQEGLAAAGCPVKELRIQLPRSEHRVTLSSARVFIELGGIPEGVPSWLSVGFKESFDRHFPEYGPSANDSFQTMWADVAVPALWDPQRVGGWALDALAFDADRRRGEQAERESKEAATARAVAKMKGLIDADGDV